MKYFLISILAVQVILACLAAAPVVAQDNFDLADNPCSLILPIGQDARIGPGLWFSEAERGVEPEEELLVIGSSTDPEGVIWLEVVVLEEVGVSINATRWIANPYVGILENCPAAHQTHTYFTFHEQLMWDLALELESGHTCDVGLNPSVMIPLVSDPLQPGKKAGAPASINDFIVVVAGQRRVTVDGFFYNATWDTYLFRIEDSHGDGWYIPHDYIMARFCD